MDREVMLSAGITLVIFVHSQLFGTVSSSTLNTPSSSSSLSSYAWGPWSEWSSCSVECGPGLQERSRSCRQYGACPASNEVQSRSCQEEACPASEPSYRQKACSRYDKRIFSGKQYMWEPFIHASDPCKLACRAKGVHFYANLAKRVRDGELCHRKGHPKAVCFRGVCKPLGCDNVVLSPARKDKCGVCMGDGTECKTVAGIFTNTLIRRGINSVISIPAGSTNINITELSPSENLLLMQAASGKVFINAGKDRPTSGMINAAGTMFKYNGKTSVHPKESILSDGPTNTSIHVKLLSRGSNPGIAYTFNVAQRVNDSYIQALTGQNVEPITVKSAPQFIEDNTSPQSSVDQSALQASHEQQEENDDDDDDVTQTNSNTQGNENLSPTASYPVVTTYIYSALAHNKDKKAREYEDIDYNAFRRPVDNVKNVLGVTPRFKHTTHSLELHNSEADSLESSGDVEVEIDIPKSGLTNNQVTNGKNNRDDLTPSSAVIDNNISESDNDQSEEYDETDDDEEDNDSNDYDYDDDDDNDDDDDDDETREEDEENSALIDSVISDHKINYNGNEDDALTEAKYLSQERHQSVRIPLHSVVNPNEIKGWENRNKVNVTYFDNEKVIENANTDFDRSDSNDDTTYTTIPESSTTPAPSYYPSLRSSSHKSRPFKVPRFSNSFTFASKYKNSYPTKHGSSSYRKNGRNSDINENNESVQNSHEKLQDYDRTTTLPDIDSKRKKRIRIAQHGHHGSKTRGYKSSPTTVRGRDYLQRESWRNERRRASRQRQARIDERNRRLRQQMEEYNQRLQEHREMIKKRQMERKRALAQRHHSSRGTSLENRRSSLENDKRRTKTRNLKAAVKVSPSSSSSSSAYEQSVHIISTGKNSYNVVRKPSVINRISSPKARTPFDQETTSDFTGKTKEKVVEVIPRVRSSSHSKTFQTSSGQRVIPRVNSVDKQNTGNPRVSGQEKGSNQISPQRPRKIIPRISGTKQVSPQESRKIIPRISGHEKGSNPSSSQGTRKIIPRVSETNTPINPSLSSNTQGSTTKFNGNSKVFEKDPRTVTSDGGRIINPNINQPRYIPNERESLTSALSGGSVPEGGDPVVIPNRVNTNDFGPVVPDPSRVGKKSLKTAEDVDGFYNNEWRISGLTECTHSCGGGVQQTVVVCVDTRTQAVVTDENCRQVRRPKVKAVTCNKRPCPAQWVPSPWTPCSVTCGDGEQTRTVTCQARVSPTLNLTMPESRCQNSPSPVQRQNCSPQPCSSWTIGNWSKCSADCGDGVRSRTVDCVGLDQAPLDDNECDQPKPVEEEKCNAGSCGKGWFFTPWPEECPVACGTGVVTRKVFCVSESGEAIPESRCDQRHRPESSRPCKVDTPCGGIWYTGKWSRCNVTCGKGFKSREVLCVKSLPGGVFAVVDDENCAGSPKPSIEDVCLLPHCEPEWYMSSWGQCSQSCDTGYRTRETRCLSPSQHNSDQCPAQNRPRMRESCNTNACRRTVPERTGTADNGDCKDKFTQCRIVKRARLCKYNYYKKMCCKSCL